MTIYIANDYKCHDSPDDGLVTGAAEPSEVQ